MDPGRVLSDVEGKEAVAVQRQPFLELLDAGDLATRQPVPLRLELGAARLA